MNSGVGDYSWIMVQEWAKILDQVYVLTAQPQEFTPDENNIKIFPSNSLKDFHHHLYLNISKLPIETKVLFQFTPNMYSRVGVNFQLLFTAIKLRLSGRQFSFYFHEKHYPLNFKWPDLILSLIHIFIYQNLKMLSSKILYSFNEDHDPNFPYPVIPVCSNMPIVSGNDKEVLNRNNLDQYFIYFGSTHPSKCVDWVIEAYCQLSESIQTKFPLVIVGSKIENLPCQQLITNQNIKILGYLSPIDVSNLLFHSSLVLAPFIDGVSSRRGSVLAALSNSALVVTNIGRNTNPEIPWNDFCLLSNSDSKSDFFKFVEKSVVQLRTHDGKRALAKIAYHQFFSSQKSAQRIKNILFLPDSLSSQNSVK